MEDAGPPTRARRRCDRRRRRQLGADGRHRQAARAGRRAGRCSPGRSARDRRGRGVERIVLVTRAGAGRGAGRGALAAAARSCRRRRRRGPVRVGGSPGCEALDGLDGGRRPARDDRAVLVHDGARPLVTPALVDAVARRHRARTARPSRSLPVAETLKRVVEATWSRRPSIARGSPPHRPRRASGGRSSARRSTASRRRRGRPSPTRPRCWRPVPSRSMRSPANPRTSR